MAGHGRMSTVPAEIDEAIAGEWHHLAGPGPHLTGVERVAVAATARGETPPEGARLPAVVAEAAVGVGRAAASITAEWVDELEARGLGRTAYVEIVGIASRLAAVDTFELGVGRPRRALPTPVAGAPTGVIADDARRRAGFVPTVGGINPATALSALPAEAAAQEVLHGALYLPYTTMLELDTVRDGLARTQIELLAARTSLLNDCFF